MATLEEKFVRRRVKRYQSVCFWFSFVRLDEIKFDFCKTNEAVT